MEFLSPSQMPKLLKRWGGWFTLCNISSCLRRLPVESLPEWCLESSTALREAVNEMSAAQDRSEVVCGAQRVQGYIDSLQHRLQILRTFEKSVRNDTAETDVRAFIATIREEKVRVKNILRGYK